MAMVEFLRAFEAFSYHPPAFPPFLQSGVALRFPPHSKGRLAK
jgi:hypothetical protein